jgi:ribosomal protein S18 acetylase RimI-like enzyme
MPILYLDRMPSPNPTELHLSPAQRDDWLPALNLVFRELPSDRRPRRISESLGLARLNPAAVSDLLAAYRGTEMVAAVWGQVMPGKTAVVWGPGLKIGENTAAVQKLLARLVARLADQQVRVVQGLPASSAAAEQFGGCGFDACLDLLYLAANVNPASVDHETGQSEASDLRFVPYQPDLRPEFAAVIEATYEETLDAPLLNGKRDVEDVIDGYLTTGSFNAGRWSLVRSADRAVGCLLLADHPDRDQCELVYMGLLPAERGRGWGKQLVDYALWQTAQADRQQLILAVDAENDPAIRIYSEAGFQPFLRQAVRIRFL